MTQLLEQVIAEVHKLSLDQQDQIAQIILDELADEQRWDAAFANSQDTLARLAAKARADVQAGRVVCNR
jgi:hypothetical protein